MPHLPELCTFRSNLKVVPVLANASDIKMALFGQSPEAIMQTALEAINFYTVQQQVVSNFRETRLADKAIQMKEQCNKKLAEVHNAYQNTAGSLLAVNVWHITTCTAGKAQVSVNNAGEGQFGARGSGTTGQVQTKVEAKPGATAHVQGAANQKRQCTARRFRPEPDDEQPRLSHCYEKPRQHVTKPQQSQWWQRRHWWWTDGKAQVRSVSTTSIAIELWLIICRACCCRSQQFIDPIKCTA
eukprot:364795-Chlamydomonas_euryale.AAC.7